MFHDTAVAKTDRAQLGFARQAQDDQIDIAHQRLDAGRRRNAGIIQRRHLVHVGVEGDDRDADLGRKVAAHAPAHDARADESDLLERRHDWPFPLPKYPRAGMLLAHGTRLKYILGEP